MEQLINGFTLDVPPGAFPLSTDSMILQDFVRLPKAAKVLDLGSGCGTLGLLLCARDDACQVTGMELDPAAHTAALENIRANALQMRMSSICADLRRISGVVAPGSFSCCVSNPPYFSGGAVSRATPHARQELSCTPDDLFAAAAWALKYGGDFCLVHKPERLAELIVTASAHGLEAKRLRLVRHRADGPVNLILLSFRKGGKPGLTLDEIQLTDSQGHPTKAYREIYHIQEG